MKNHLDSGSDLAAVTAVSAPTSALRGAAAGPAWRRVAVSFASIALLTAFGPPALGQTSFSELTKVNLKNGRFNDQVGISIGIDGNTMIVGAESYNGSGETTYEGAAFVYVRNANGAWVFQQQLSSDVPAPSNKFGSCVDISGDTAVVGSSENAAYVFVRSGSTWTRQARLSLGGASIIGNRCAISGNTILLGAYPESNGSGVPAGAAYVYVRSGTTWTQQARLTAIPGSLVDSRLGDAVAIQGDTVVLGDQSEGDYRGSVHVYVRNGTTWTPQQRILAADGGSGYLFGGSVAISGDTIVAGSPGQNGSGFKTGAAYVFVRSGSTWTQQQKLVTSDGRSEARFGYSVTVEGSTAILGSYLDNAVGGNGAGSAYVFQRSGTTWTETQKFYPSDLHRGSAFGYSLDMSGSNVAIGSPSDDIGTLSSQGSAYLFAANPANCTFALSSPGSGLLPPSGGSGTFTVTTQAGCAWQATIQDNVSWVTTTDAGTGSGTVTVSAAANTGKARRAEIAVNGQNIYMVSQANAVTAQPGDLDPAFTNAGSITSRVLKSNETYGVATQSDGKIVVVGTSFSPGSSSVAQVLRFHADGTLDSSFDGDGVATLGAGGTFFDVVVQSDGKIVAAGRGARGANDEFMVVRFNANGSLDSGFGTGGIVLTDFGDTVESARAVALTSDGKIVVSGSVLAFSSLGIARYNTNGSLDTTFDGDGKLSVSNAGVGSSDVKVQSDGKIVVVSLNSSSRTTVLRYNTDGSADTTFDGDGTAVIEAIGCGNAVAIANDGKIIIGGCRNGFTNLLDFAVARLNANGSLDTSFDTDGVAQANFGFPSVLQPLTVPQTTDTLTDIALQPDGKIVAAGYAQVINQFSGTPTQTALARFNTNGSLDVTFGASGTVTTGNEFPILDAYCQPNAVALQPNGKIVVAGSYQFRVGEVDVLVQRFLGEAIVSLPVLAPATASNLTPLSANISGNVNLDAGAAAITDRGVVYSLASANANPVIGGPSVARMSISGTTGPFSVTLTGLAPESAYAFKAYATNAVGTSYTAVRTFTTTSATTKIKVGDASAAEGNSGTQVFSFAVTLSSASASTVTVSYATQDGTAIAGSDYTSASGVLTFAPGETTKTISVAVLGDTTAESNEAFGVVLTGPAYATLSRAVGQGAILNDDAGSAVARAQPSWQEFFAVDSLETPYVGDFNGDLKTDIITFTRQNPNAIGDVYVALSDGAKFGANTKWHDFFAISTDEAVVIGDYNGDGKDDIGTWLLKTSRQVYVALSTGSGMLAESAWVSSIGTDPTDLLFSGDADGDGKDDLIAFARKEGKVYVATSDGTKFNAPTVWHGFFAVSTFERPRVADVNGDGRADIVTFATDSPTAFGDVYVATSDGTQFVGPTGAPNDSSKWHDFFAIRPTEEIRIGDLSGDGKDDFFTFLPPPFAQCYSVLSQGASMAENVLWAEAVAPLLGAGDNVYVGDVNGDGKGDIIIFAQKEGKVFVSLAP